MRALVRYLSTLRGARLVIGLAMLAVLALALGRGAAAAYTEILWQGQSGYAAVFWKRMLWGWGSRGVAGLAVGALVYVNLRIASTTLGGIHIRRRFGNLEISEQLPRSWVALGILATASVLGIWFGLAVPPSLGTQLLTLVSAPSWGVQDPVLGHDLGFYVFWLPVLASLVTYGLVVVFLVFTLSTAAYGTTGALRWAQGRLDGQDLVRWHLGSLVAIFFVMLGLRLWLGRYALLLDGNSSVQGIFGFADAQARLPALQTLTVISVAAGAAMLWGSLKNRAPVLIAAFASVALGMLVIGQFYPTLVQNFRVEPNELERESPYIERNMEFTRLGFGLDELERRRFEYALSGPVDWGDAARQFAGLPVWSRGALLTTYGELEARFPYYDFSEVTIDRYPSATGDVPVAISVREVVPGGIQDPNWQNQHIRELYIEGMGAVASLASAKTPEGRPQMLIGGIPPERTALAEEITSLRLERSAVFFGTRPQLYAIVNTRGGQFLSPDSSAGLPGVDFPNGIALASGLRTAMLAWRFRDANLLFASELTDESRFIYRRRVLDRVRAIAPFLRFPETPYPVVSGGRIVWILEGFSGTRFFPLSTAQTFGAQFSQLSYLRNSVKVTVDAVTGDVAFYRVPVEDPLTEAYARAFPDLFRPISTMPDDLRGHVRYSRELLELQARVLLQYHQETAPAFHGQRDVWDGPQELAENTNPVPYRSEYGIYRLPGDEEPGFNLTTVFVPAGRQNLTAILAATADESGVPRLRLWDVPVADQVPGPRQIEALVEQDPIISQQFSLWRTGGSEVWTGHLHLVPVGTRLLYMEPVFLAAEADAIPELRRFVVSDGTRVVMTEDLTSAIAQLAGRASAAEGDAGEGGEGPPTVGAWPAAALRLLERAEGSARSGDWQSFGQALAELRAFLARLEAGGP